MVAGFDVTLVNRNGQITIFMRGEILSARGQVDEALLTAQHASGDVIVDLSQVTFIDSTGINALVRARREALDGRFYVVGASERIRRVFEITGVAEYLEEPLRTTEESEPHDVAAKPDTRTG
jgi:anti-sigma B factor antagonist